jgi:Matrixin
LKTGIVGLLAGLVCGAAVAGAGEDIATFKPLKLEGNAVSWQANAGGRKPAIAYWIVTQPAEFPGARNCRSMTTMDGLQTASAIDPAAVRAELAAAFAMWERAANVSFRAADSAATADILIGAQAEPAGWAFADVFYDTRSAEPVKPISRALICLNPTKRWKVGFDGDLNIYDLRYTFAHEIGHALGLDHPNGAGQIMGYRYEERFRELQAGDIAGITQLYGAPQPDTVIAGTQTRSPQASAQSPAAPHAVKRAGSRAITARSP